MAGGHLVSNERRRESDMRTGIVILVLLSLTSGAAAQGSGAAQTATINLSVAQLKSLRENPVVLVPAPGAGNSISPVSAIIQYNFGTQHYAGGHGRFALTLGPYDSQSPLDVFDDVLTTGFTDQDSDQTVTIQGYPPDPSLSNNLDLEITNFGPPLIDGDGTVTVTVNYTVVSVQ